MGYKVLQEVTRGFRGVEGVQGYKGVKGLQGITRSYTGLQ